MFVPDTTRLQATSTAQLAAIRLLVMLRRALLAAILAPLALWAQKPIGEVQSSDAAVRGSVVLGKTGTAVMSGSQISAQASTAVLKLTRGGEIRICPGSSVTLSSSNNGRENLVGLSAGTIEAHYELASSADSVMTPDFRILLPGPGSFHFGFGLAPGGDVCVKSLPGSTSSVIVSEMFGEGTHQVKQGEQIVFHAGRVENASLDAGDTCTCSVSEPAAARAAATTSLGFPEQESQRAAVALAAGHPLPDKVETLPQTAVKPGQIAMQVDAPMIFQGEEPAPTAKTVFRTNLAAVHLPALLDVQPTIPQRPPEKKWYQKVGTVFSHIFGRKSKPSS